jgi:alpha-L-fucosidase
MIANAELPVLPAFATDWYNAFMRQMFSVQYAFPAEQGKQVAFELRNEIGEICC